MKKLFKKVLSFFGSLLFGLGVLLLVPACQQDSSSEVPVAVISDSSFLSSDAYLCLSVGSPSARTIYPVLDTEWSDYKMTLTGTQGNSEVVLFADVLTSEVPSKLKVSPGNWKFKLTAIKSGFIYSQTKDVTIEAGNNSVDFALALDVDAITATKTTGFLQFEVAFAKNGSRVTSVKVEADGTIPTLPDGCLTTSGFNYKLALPAGLHKVSLTFYDRETCIAQTIDYEFLIVGDAINHVKTSVEFKSSNSVDIGIGAVTFINPDSESFEVTLNPTEASVDTSMFNSADVAYVQELVKQNAYNELKDYYDELVVLGKSEFATYVKGELDKIAPAPEVKEFTGYVVPGTYQTTNTAGDKSTLVIAEKSISWNSVEYQILDGAQWLENKTKDAPLRYAYLVNRDNQNYLCSVWYYINNGMEYIKFNSPVESALTSCPVAYDYQSSDCNTGSLSKSLVAIQDVDWKVDFGSVDMERTRSNGDDLLTFTTDGVTHTVDFHTWVKNMDLSMPSGDGRTETHVDEAIWWSTSKTSPNLLAQPSGYSLEFGYPLPTGNVFYELQCCERSGMYLLSVTAAKLVWFDDALDTDGDGGDYAFSYEVVHNLTLTKEQYDSLMVHFR